MCPPYAGGEIMIATATATMTTDCYILTAEFRTADKIKKCDTCEILLSKLYAVTDVDDLTFHEPECYIWCGVGRVV